MQWSVFPTRYPFGVYGHCSVISEDGGSIHSSGGWSDNEEALNSAFVLELGDNTVSASSRWEKVSPMRVGRSTHACLPTKYKVKVL